MKKKKGTLCSGKKEQQFFDFKQDNSQNILKKQIV